MNYIKVNINTKGCARHGFRDFIMRNVLLVLLFVLIPSVSYAQVNHAEWIEHNDIKSIELYCRQQLFATYGGYGAGDIFVSPIDNATANKVIDLLRHGVYLKSPNCQFMLACVLSGNKTIRSYDDDYNEVILPTSKDYKYLNDEEAKRYFKLYLSNPKMDKESGAFVYSIDQIMKLIKNAYPELLIDDSKARKESIKKAASDEIKDSAPTFGLG